MSYLRRRFEETAVLEKPEPPMRKPRSADKDRQLLGDLLVQRGLVSRAQVAEALEAQAESGKWLGTVLVELGAVEESALLDALSSQFHVPVIDLSVEHPEAFALGLLDETEARNIVAVPIRVEDDAIDIAVADPSPGVHEALMEATGKDIHLFVAPASEIRRTIDSSYRVLGGIDRLVQTFEAAESARRVVAPTDVSLAEDAPVVKVVSLILTQALRDRASDVHIEPQADRLRIRFRIDGSLHDIVSLPAAMAGALVSRLKVMAEMNIVERRRSQDGKFTITVDNRDIDVRVATTATISGENCVMRLLDKSRPMHRLSDLGMPEETGAVFSRLVRSPFGMVICAGPTGSGKTTSLYATLSEINSAERKLMTIEDPVEYVFPSINQIQTNEQAGLTFASGLRSILRQDPDVILVGEIRDAETARIAIQSALTGHFVLSSLHATDSAAALHRFLDMGIEAFLISSSVLGVVGQRLVRRICAYCAAPYQPTDDELAFYREVSGGRPAKTAFIHGVGCSFCADTGYQDRVGIYELLRITPEIRRLVVGWATQEEIRRMAVAQGMRTLLDEALRLVDSDLTTIAEVMRNVYSV
jgi:type IV pilus assembly protein PilB